MTMSAPIAMRKGGDSRCVRRDVEWARGVRCGLGDDAVRALGGGRSISDRRHLHSSE